MKIGLDLDEVEVTHTLEALRGVASIVETRSDELVVGVILRNVIAKIETGIRRQS